jgi:hypothetical protein
MGGFYAFLILLCLATKLSKAPVVSIPLVVFAGVMLIRHLRGASVELGDDEVVIRGLRSRRIAWTQIRDVTVARGSSVTPFRWRVPEFVLVDGSLVLADEIRSLRVGTIVDDVVSAGRQHLT